MKIPVSTAARANLQHWKAGQGARIKANRPVEVYLACEHMARMHAAVRDPLDLTSDELAVCVKRAISQERNKRHEHEPAYRITADEWWSQIGVIAEQWGIKTTRDQWERSTKTDPKKEAA